MPSFPDVAWTQFDFWAIVADAGLAAVDDARRPACLAWLQRNGYQVSSLDCSKGLQTFIRSYCDLLRWQEQFGYDLSTGNLNAMRDGFAFDATQGNGHVLELVRPDVLWKKDQAWCSGFLAITQEHSRVHLAVGERFFTLLIVPPSSSMLGAVFDHVRVPGLFRSPHQATNDFLA